ncbi:GumC family protein [Ferruginivarius sediminum]|nr:Wzz/FepE/Etk N-terminal domain-containing protein [Ferruginivarius sediminum]
MAARQPQSPAAPDGADALRVLWRRRSTVAGVAALILLATALVTLAVPESYTATAEVMLMPREAADTDGGETGSGTGAAIASEVEVLRSRELLRRVVRERQLLLDPEFNPAVRPAGGLFSRLGFVATPSPRELRIERQRARTVAALREKMSVRILGRSRVIEVAVLSRDADKAARIANALVQDYLAQRQAAVSRARARTSDALEARVARQRERVEAAERALENHRRESGLAGDGGAGVDAKRLGDLEAKLVDSRAERAKIETRLAALRRGLEESGPNAVPTGLRSPLAEELQAQLAKLLRRKWEMSPEYGPRHPRMVDVNAELEGLRQELAEEGRRILSDLRGELEVARAHEMTLELELGEMRRKTDRQADARTRLRRLQRKMEAEGSLLNTLSERLERTSLSQGLQQPDARVISAASPPSDPSTPWIGPVMILAFLTALLSGIGAAMLMERFDRTVATPDMLEAHAGLKVLASVPSGPVPTGRERRLARHAISEPTSDFAESVRCMYAGMQNGDPERTPRSILVTSALPQEGKTTLAVTLARMLARERKRVILVEADLRRPRAHRFFGWKPGFGLAEYLAGRVPLQGVIRRDRESGLHVICAGEAGRDPGRRLSGRRLALTVEALAAHYDAVIVDSPPTLPFADARVLAPLTDATILVTRWRKTPRESVALAARTLRDAGAMLSGAVLSRVDSKRYRHYDTADKPIHGRALRAHYKG